MRVAFDFYERDQRFAGSLLAGGLSVKFFLWFLPFSLSVVVLIGALAGSTDRPPAELASQAGLAAALAGMVEDAVRVSDRAAWYLAVLGVVLLFWTGLGVVRALRLTSRLAWEMNSAAPMRMLLASLVVVGIVIALLAVQWGRDRLLGGPWPLDLVVLVAAILAMISIFVFVFDHLPHPEEVGWTAMLPGALLMTVGLLVMRLATFVYFQRRLDTADDLYGGLGMAAVFLAWLYILSRMLVASISLNATLWQNKHLTDHRETRPAAAGPSPAS